MSYDVLASIWPDFDEGLDSNNLKLTGATTFATGVIALHYELAPA